ncbi:MAG: hypothetical protein Q4F41_01435 [Eubacteriales bacterium]|nr:hypothetical protein [Eubacteriales bacterium]
MTNQENQKEIREAIQAANLSLDSLERVERSLNGARNWGLWDLFGGGMFVSMMKHSRLDDAKMEMEEARYYLRQLQKELRDIDVPMDIRVEVSSFLTFADFFFDGVIADWLVQSRIGEAREQVITAKARVLEILADLHNWENRLLQNGGQ